MAIAFQEEEVFKWLREDLPHYECEEDCWYSCAKITCNENRASETCDCGADTERTMRTKVLLLLEELKWKTAT